MNTPLRAPDPTSETMPAAVNGRRLRGLLFDFDGTIAETERYGQRVAYNRAFADLGLDWTWDEELYADLLTVAGGKERLRYYLERYHPPLPEGTVADDLVVELHRAKVRNFARIAPSIPFRPGIKRLIREAHQAGCRIAIVTTASQPGVEALLAQDETLPPKIDLIAANEAVERKKPAPDVYQWALDRLGLDAGECVAIEDSRIGLTSALSAGLTTLVTISDYTKEDDFRGAAAVLSDLGERAAPASCLRGSAPSSGIVTVAYLQSLLVTDMIPHEHSRRRSLYDEAHARPPESLCPPLRISYLALFGDETASYEGWRCVQQLAKRFDATPPDDAAQHFRENLGAFRIKCERHTEFLRIKAIVEGPADHPFDKPALSALPPDWVANLPGEILVAANVALMQDTETHDLDRMAAEFFENNVLIGSSIAGGAASAFTDFRIHKDGFSRFLVVDRSMTPRQAGRMVQRMLELDTYRILALMALPVARELSPLLLCREYELANITRTLAQEQSLDEARLFERLTNLTADMENKQTETLQRFNATTAYYALVQRRISELREERLPGLQTFREFTERRLAPAMSTCQAVAAQQISLSERLARATQLLATRVGINRERQNQALLESMDRRAGQQLRLQQTVEGLSIAAITYYVAGLIVYAAKGLKTYGLRIDVDVVVAVSIPVIVILTALGLRRLRQLITAEDGCRDVETKRR